MIKLYRLTISRILSTLIILSTPGDANGKIRISYRVAEIVCASSAKFATTNQIIERSAKFSFIDNNDVPCKTLGWNHQCRQSRNGKPCEKFELNVCTEPISTTTGTGTGAAHEQTSTSMKGSLLRNINQKFLRIINGTDAQPHQFPYIVKIIINNKFLCGGTIWNENYIITAAHCVQPMPNSTVNNYVVYAGAHKLRGNESIAQVRTPKRVIPHHAYPSFFESNDIALMELDVPLEFSDIVYPPKLPDKNYGDSAAGKIGTIVGWGSVANNKTSLVFPDVLQTAEVPIISHEDCKELYKQPIVPAFFPPYTICAGTPGRGSCFGDSGSPLVLRSKDDCDLFIGITSFTRGCAEEVPTAFCPVSHHLDWIALNAV